MAGETESVHPPDRTGDAVDPEYGDEVRDAFLAWVVEHFTGIEHVHTDKRAPWCAEWWRHPEVVARLWALWQARLQADEDSSVRLDAVSDWWLTHWDRHAAILLDPRTGPFRKCDRTLCHLHETHGAATPGIDIQWPPSDWRVAS